MERPSNGKLVNMKAVDQMKKRPGWFPCSISQVKISQNLGEVVLWHWLQTLSLFRFSFFVQESLHQGKNIFHSPNPK